jgi:TRAP-type C4-dicarboxylate transport system permease small subunit
MDDTTTPRSDTAVKIGPVTLALDKLSQACRLVAMVGLVIITLVQAWQVFGRYVLNDSPGWTEPVSVFFMALTVMMAAAVGVREGTHFAFPNVREALPAPMQKAAMVVIHLLTLGVALVLSVWGIGLAASAWDIVMAGAPLPAGLRYIPVAIGAAVMAVFAAERLVSTLTEKKA